MASGDVGEVTRSFYNKRGGRTEIWEVVVEEDSDDTTETTNKEIVIPNSFKNLIQFLKTRNNNRKIVKT